MKIDRGLLLFLVILGLIALALSGVLPATARGAEKVGVLVIGESSGGIPAIGCLNQEIAEAFLNAAQTDFTKSLLSLGWLIQQKYCEVGAFIWPLEVLKEVTLPHKGTLKVLRATNESFFEGNVFHVLTFRPVVKGKAL